MNCLSEKEQRQWRYEDFVTATSPEYILRQTAEECCELAQAALKVIRARNGETPMGSDAATDALIEEIADTLLMVDIVRYAVIPKHMLDVAKVYSQKWERFKKRVLET